MEKMNMRKVEVNSEGIMDLNLVLLASGGNGSQVRVSLQALSITYLHWDSMPTQPRLALLPEVKDQQYLLPSFPQPPLLLLLEAKVVHLPRSLLLFPWAVKVHRHLHHHHLGQTLPTQLNFSSS
jgi:hypothetical protein